MAGMMFCGPEMAGGWFNREFFYRVLELIKKQKLRDKWIIIS